MTLNLVFLVKQKSVTWLKVIADVSRETIPGIIVTETHMSANISVFKEVLKIAVLSFLTSKPMVVNLHRLRTAGIGN